MQALQILFVDFRENKTALAGCLYGWCNIRLDLVKITQSTPDILFKPSISHLIIKIKIELGPFLCKEYQKQMGHKVLVLDSF